MAISDIPTTTNVSTRNAVARVPRAVAFRYDVLPLAYESGVLTIGIADPDDRDRLRLIEHATRCRLATVPMTRDQIRTALRVAYDVASADAVPDRSAEAPAVRAVDAIIARAVAAHASDVHVEPHDEGGIVRFRIDGMLAFAEAIPADRFGSLVSRIKVLAGLDIADKRQPQDGRFTLRIDGRALDLRVASMPTVDGEKLAIRLLDLHAEATRLEALGMSDEFLIAYREIVALPWGFLVVTGPTSSGKTTTLYASLAELDLHARNVCTVEDPVELRLPGVCQVGVNPRANLTFASVLRGFMRQDPDVLMIGEIRDAETANVAISAALAGQFVFATLHSNDAPRTVERLVELGVSRGSLAAGLTAVLAQRLVRRLCERCRTPAVIPPAIVRELDVDEDIWYVPRGCTVCDGTGYIGRIGVYELLTIDDSMREAIARGDSSTTLARFGAAHGYRPMIADGVAKLVAGTTSYAELRRVLGRATVVV